MIKQPEPETFLQNLPTGFGVSQHHLLFGFGPGHAMQERNDMPPVKRAHLSVPDPAVEKEEKDFKEYLNPASLEILEGCKVEPGLADARPGEFFQFLRQGYFCVDSRTSRPGRLVFNRTVTLKDTWAKESA